MKSDFETILFIFISLLENMIFLLYMFGYMFYFGEQCGFVYTESFKLFSDFLLLCFTDDIRFIGERESCRLAFVTVYAIKKESSRLSYYTRVVKHRFYTKYFLYVF